MEKTYKQNKLIIVESPTKAGTISRYLGKDYRVLASRGHIRDLATTGRDGLGIDINNNFAPNYEVSAGKQGIVKYLTTVANDSEEVILATDPDREGEAISWHIADQLKLDINKTKRMEFHEITKKGVENARDNPRLIDMKLVESQETRRILDRIIGFKLSQLLQSKLNSKSAGRVQSVALSIIVEREREISNFTPITTYFLDSKFKIENKTYHAYNVNENNEKIKYPNIVDAEEVFNKLSLDYEVLSINKEEKKYESRPAYTTSSLQQDAFNKLKFPAKKTMRVAQSLYEGKKLGDETAGLITYMRTDSVRLSPLFIYAAKNFIRENFGEEYVGFAKSQKENDNVQNAHEGIRPAEVTRTPDSVKDYLTPDEFNLYKMIWCRAVSSIMKAQLQEKTDIILSNNNYRFLMSGSKIIFDGYQKVFGEYEKFKLTATPEHIETGEILKSLSTEIKDETTEPPSRFSEARLIRTMEELGIGRPSTYASTIETIKSRRYVEVKKGFLVPTEQGEITTKNLEQYFNDFINIQYTAKMESDLDLIAEGKLGKLAVLNGFYENFKSKIENAWEEMPKIEREIEPPQELDQNCPKCGKVLVIRKSKYGNFVGCSGYPKCKYIAPTEKKEEYVEITCPKCQKGQLRLRRGRFGEFWGCSNYPDCDYILKK